MNVRDIHTINWQLSLNSPGSIVTGMDDVRQCVDVILKTRKGEDPLRPHFGCGLFDWISKPNTAAIPNMKKEILEALRLYEPRITVQKIGHELVNGGVKFGIVYKLPYGDSDFFELSTEGGEVSTGPELSQMILQADYTEGAFRYTISLALGGADVLPPPPVGGFASISDLFAWVTNYWYLYGAWHWLFGQKKVVLYVPSNVAVYGAMSIQSLTNVLSAEIPVLTNSDDERYQIIFNDASNTRIMPYNGDDINTPGQILAFVQTNYGSYGTWSILDSELVLNGSVDLTGFSLTIEVNEPVFTGAYNDGFNPGFEI